MERALGVGSSGSKCPPKVRCLLPELPHSEGITDCKSRHGFIHIINFFLVIAWGIVGGAGRGRGK